MKHTYLLLALIFTLFMSCPGDDTIVEPPEPEPIDEHLISEFVWETFIDSTTILERERYTTQYPILFDNMIVYANYEKDGFVALDKTSGIELWNNYGQTELEYLRESPIVHNGAMLFVNEGVFKVINLADGAIITDYLWDDTGVSLGQSLAVFEGKVYASITYTEGGIAMTEWLVSSDSSIPIQDWERFNKEENTAVGKAYFHTLPSGEKLMLYGSNPMTTLNAYNIEEGEIEWSNSNSQARFDMIIDEERIYSARGRWVYAFKIETGERLWDAESHNDIDGGPGLVIVGNDLFAIDSEIVSVAKETGEVNWIMQNYEKDDGSTHSFSGNSCPVSLYQDKMYFFESFGNLISLDPSGDSDYFYIPDSRAYEGLAVDLQLLNFKNSFKVVSDEGIIYTHDNYRFLAFEIPER